MIKNASKDYHYQIVVLYQTLSDENQAKIKALENETFQFHLNQSIKTSRNVSATIIIPFGAITSR